MDNRSRVRTSRRRNDKRLWFPKNSFEQFPAREAKEIPDGCICQRSKRLVLCSICGFKMIGRVRITCPAHPQTIFLMDLDRCPQCLANSSILKEYSDV